MGRADIRWRVCIMMLACLWTGCQTPPEPVEEPPPPSPPPPRVVEVQVPSPPEIELVEIPLQPITTALISRLGTGAIPGFQYYISHPVILVNERSELRRRNTGGGLELTNALTRDVITIDGITKGEVVGIETARDGKMALVTSFELDRDLNLRFIQSGDGYFDLDVRDGTVLYGAVPYRVLAPERLTRLLINLESRNDVQEFNRYAPGREVHDPSYGVSDTIVDQRALPGLDLSFDGQRRQYYRVQVGSFANIDNARRTFDRLQAAGLNPAYDQYNDLCRVILLGVSADDIPRLTRELASAGFPNPWIQEEN